MNILVTGVTGFIGRSLVNVLKKDYTVHVLLRPSSIIIDSDINNIFYFDKDITELHRYILENNIEGIVHLASLFLSSHTSEDITGLINSNIYLGTALLEASLNTQVKWFLNTGTFWQHYLYNQKHYCPVNLYAATKQAFIDIAKYYTEISIIQFATLKICDTYGVDDDRPKIINLFKKISKTGESLSMSLGEQYMDILYIDDVVEGFICLIKMFNIGDQQIDSEYVLYAAKRYKLKEIAGEFEKVSGRKLNINWGEREYRDREVMIPWEKGNKLPKWEPKVSLEEGLSKII